MAYEGDGREYRGGKHGCNRRVSAFGGQGARVIPVGDIELEIVFRIAVRGRTRDLAQLLEAMSKAGAVVMWVVEGLTESEEQGQKDLTATGRGFSR